MYQSNYISPRTDFGKPPKGYIPGAGRGAVGFTTRSDIGPARQAVVPIDRSISAQKERARQILLQRQGISASNDHNTNESNTESNGNNGNDIEDKHEDLNDSLYDPFTGYASNLFSAGSYDDEDREADIIYSTIDKRQDSKRKRRREERQKLQWEEYHKKRPKVHEYFQNEKRLLANLELNEWINIPEPMDLSRRRRAKQSRLKEKYTPVPSHIIEGAHHQMSKNVNVDDMDTKYGGWQTNASNVHNGAATDLTQLGRARDRHLGIQLDKMADSVSGQTVVDPKGYLTDLTSISISSDTDVSDIRKARQLLKSVVTTNPHHPPGWIAAARLEEAAGKLVAARTMILRGTHACPSSQDMWIEAARLHSPKEAKRILATAVNKIPKSVKIWLRAAQFESDLEDKKAVLRKALEIIPNSIILWQTAIDFEDANNARIMLSRAVECVPQCVSMWIALSKLESYQNAKKILNRARISCPKSKLVFIESAKLEETNGKNENVSIIIKKAINTLSANKIVINKESWLNEAAKCENCGCLLSCKEIVFEVLKYENLQNNEDNFEVDGAESDKLLKYKGDAEEWLNNKSQVHVSRSIYEYILKKWNKNEQIWWDAAQLERRHGTIEQTKNLLKKAVKACPQCINLWLFAAKIEKDENNANEARKILNCALSLNANCQNDNKNEQKIEKIWLALCRLEIFVNDFDSAKKIMKRAQTECKTSVIFLHSAKLIRRINGGGSNEELKLLKFATFEFKTFDKLWMMLLQCVEYRNEHNQICKIAENALKYCSNSIHLWLEYVRILSSIQMNKYGKARSVLQNATLQHPKCDILWLSAAKLELFEHLHHNEDNNEKLRKKAVIYRNDAGYAQCKSLIAKGLQQCPQSGKLYAFEIEIEAVASKKSKCVHSIKKCPNDVFVFVQVAKYFVQINKKKRAKEWFERAVIADALNGDAWAYFYYFADDKEKENILKRTVSANPKYGELWIRISKKIGNEGLSKRDILNKVIEEEIAPFDGFPIQVI